MIEPMIILSLKDQHFTKGYSNDLEGTKTKISV